MPTTKGMDVAQLGKFSPFNALKEKNLAKLLDEIEILQATQGQKLFKKGDSDKRALYVISGTVLLQSEEQVMGSVVGGTEDAGNPISPVLPRQFTAIASDDVEYFRIDSELLDVTVTLDQTGIYEVSDFNSGANDEEGDWMSALLCTKTFQLIPPQNIQTIFMRLKRFDFKAGHVVIRQGSEGEHFYIIKSGRCMVTRETPFNQEGIDLAELGVGHTFGEEALLSNEVRNATVTMMTDGTLMQLGREDFQSLMNEPMIVSLDHDDADEAVNSGRKWLDVRVPSEFKTSAKSNAMNLPLYLLRHKLNDLDRETPYVVYCDTGRRSSAAAFILNQQGFKTAVLKGGLNRSELA